MWNVNALYLVQIQINFDIIHLIKLLKYYAQYPFETYFCSLPYVNFEMRYFQDTLREDCDPSDNCERNCCVSPIIAPVFFVVFVLMAQFVLVNVVVAVLMKHLEVGLWNIAANF